MHSPAPAAAPARVPEAGAPRFIAPGAAILVGLLAFGFRVLTDRGLSNDHYMHMAWAQQVLLGDLPGRDFVDPGMPLAYLLSAAVQYMFPFPFSEAMFSSAMLAVAAAFTCVIVVRLTRSVAWGVAAALFEIALQPRFYSFPKILVPAVALTMLWWYLDKPSRLRMAALAVWTVTATLLRYDLGVYTTAACAVGLAVYGGRNWRGTVRTLASYTAWLLVISLPYVVFVASSEGIAEHIRGGLEFSKSEQHQLMLELLPLPLAMVAGPPASWNAVDSATLLAQLARLLPAAALLLVVLRRRHLTPERRAVVAAGMALLVAYVTVILRYPLPARIQDLAAVLAIVGAWTCVESLAAVRALASRPTAMLRVAAAVLAATVVIVTAVGVTSVWVLGNVRAQMLETRVQDGWRKVGELFATRLREGTRWPWQAYWPAGPVPDAIRYVRECTAQSDRLLVTWPAAEYYYFSGRGFGAGHSQFLAPRAFTGTRDQQLMLARMEGHNVPVVFINETERAEFTNSFPLVDAYLRERYTPVGQFTIHDDQETISVVVKSTLRATSQYGPDHWPCGFVPPDAAPAQTAAPYTSTSGSPASAISPKI